MASMQDTKTLLAAAKALMDELARDRAEIAKILVDGDGEPWFIEIGGSAQTRMANIEADINHARGRLAAIREELTARGLTQADCKAIWQAMHPQS